VFAPDTGSGLARVDAAGGSRVPLTTLDGKETSHRWPDFLPDGNHFLYLAHGFTSADSGIYLAALDSKESASCCCATIPTPSMQPRDIFCLCATTR
jgi:hypothetical protein